MIHPRLTRPGALLGFFTNRRTLIEWIALLALSVLFAVILIISQTADRADNLVHDALVRYFPAPVDEDIVIVGIDNDSLAQLGAWPWARTTHARAIAQISAANPRAIVYDVLFVDPSVDPAEDDALAKAVADGAPSFLPLLIEVPGRNGTAADVRRPLPALSRAMTGSGQVIAPLDRDGILRRANLTPVLGGKCQPHLIIVVQAWLSSSEPSCETSVSGLIPYAGSAGRYPRISFASLVAGEVPPELLHDKIVMVGATASGMGDQYATPMRNATDLMPGIEVQANLLAALSHGGLSHDAGLSLRLAFTLFPLITLWIGFLFLSPRGNLLLAAGLMLALLTLSTWLFLHQAIWVGPIPAFIVIVAILPLWGWRRLAAASRYIVDELNRLRSEPGVLPPVALPQYSDRLQHQMALLSGAIGQVRTLKHFVEALQDGLPDAILVTRPDGSIALANECAHEIARRYGLSYSMGQLATLAAAFRELVRDKDAYDALTEVFRNDRLAQREHEITLRDGTAYLLRVKPFSDGALGFFHIIRLTDITSLHETARQREMMLEFLTHDMRSPQVSILALLSRANPQEMPSNIARRIEGHARQTLDLAEQFVQIARAEAAAYDISEIDLNDVAIEAADQLWSQADARGITITVTPDTEELILQGNPELLVRAIANLVGNAVKYCAPGNTVTVLTRATPHSIICSVTDDGPGMDADQVARVFESFTRFRPQTADPADIGAGVGLGLAFVRVVVTRHGGTVDCESELGKGTCFTVRLPRTLHDSEDYPHP